MFVDRFSGFNVKSDRLGIADYHNVLTNRQYVWYKTNERKEDEEMSYSKLRGKIKEVFGRQDSFAEAMKMDSATLSAKLNNKTPWKDDEIVKSCELLGIQITEVHEYFFCAKSCENAI